MPKNVTIDSSVFISSLIKTEPNHNNSQSIINKVFNEEYFVIIPITVLVEVCSALSRRTNDEYLSNYVMDVLLNLPNIVLVELEIERAMKASLLGIEKKLRGMDAIILQTVNEFSTELITYDKELKAKSK